MGAVTKHAASWRKFSRLLAIGLAIVACGWLYMQISGTRVLVSERLQPRRSVGHGWYLDGGLVCTYFTGRNLRKKWVAGVDWEECPLLLREPSTVR